MKAAVVTKDHHVDVTYKTLRSLKHGEALLKMECCGVCHTAVSYTHLTLPTTERV